MGRDEPPFLYDAPQNQRVAYPYSNFNPRASTQATYQALIDRSAPKPKPQGPLINFNRHPDSYIAVPAPGNVVPSMPSNTKRKVGTLRGIQLVIRILTAIAAIGLLVATICVMNTEGAMTYLLRIPSAWDSIISLYAIYHLFRPAKSRTPASSASYHFFALFMDGGLIPFYVFIALAGYNNWKMDPNDERRWTTFFSGPTNLNTVLFSIFAGACGVGGLHLISIFLDIWLIVIFRKISSLPPDMNPLEDNLTSRRSAKHKHKNSELTLHSNGSTLTENEKKSGYLSGSTLSVDDQSRLSMLKDPVYEESSAVPFMHSRKESDLAFTPHTPESIRWSRQQLKEQISPRFEIRDTSSWNRHPTNHEPNPYRLTLDFEHRYYAKPDDVGVAVTTDLNHYEPKEDLEKDNWFTADSNTNKSRDPVKRDSVHDTVVYNNEASTGKDQPRLSKYDSFNKQLPLQMNPPTPPPDAEIAPPVAITTPKLPPPVSSIKRTPVPNRSTTLISNSSSIYSESVPALHVRPKSETPKGKYYGDLSAATFAVRGPNGTPKSAARGLPSPVASRSPSPEKQDQTDRVVSRTGADIADEAPQWQDQGQSPYGMRNRRDVSGKVAEEGRGGKTNGTWSGGRLFR